MGLRGLALAVFVVLVLTFTGSLAVPSRLLLLSTEQALLLLGPLSVASVEAVQARIARSPRFWITEWRVIVARLGGIPHSEAMLLNLIESVRIEGHEIVIEGHDEIFEQKKAIRFGPLGDPGAALAALEAARRAEPRPQWVLYPGMHPVWGGWRQGESAHWSDHTWWPFFQRLTREAQRDYLERWKVPDEWREHFEWHFTRSGEGK